MLWWARRKFICNYTFFWSNLTVEARLSSVLTLGLHFVFFFSVSVCNNCFKFSNFEKLILKYLKKILPVIFQTSKQSVKFSFLFSCSEHLMNPVFSFFFFFRFSSSTRRKSPKAIITISSQRSIPTTANSGSSTLQNRRSVKLLDYSSGIPSYNADFHDGHGTARAGQGRGMACVN